MKCLSSLKLPLFLLLLTSNALLLSGCGETVLNVGKTTTVESIIPIQKRPRQASLTPLDFAVLKENQVASSDLVCLSPEAFETQLENYRDILRYILESRALIQYYEDSIKRREQPKEETKKGP